jgi:hypothetical protein
MALMSRDELSTRVEVSPTTSVTSQWKNPTIQLLLKTAEALGCWCKRIVCSNQRQCNISDGSGGA